MTSRQRRTVLSWLFLAPVVIVILFPYVVMVSTALKPSDEIFVFPPRWLPSRLAFENLSAMWVSTGFGRALLNSLIVGFGQTLLCIIFAIPAAYATARLTFTGSKLYRQFLLVTQMLSPIVLVIGLFRFIAGLGLIDSLLALILTGAAFNLAFAIWMLQSFMATIPREIEEAAWIDGASRIQSLVLVFLPLAAPALAVTCIFTFIASWNEFALALTLLRSGDQATLPLRIFTLVGGAYRIEWQQVMAATTLSTLPVALIFAFLQRRLVSGLALGAVK
ncbi:carbohydrate ABC transporter membrane protein 2, CUT1 family [Arboricoccus pini]|uniref:Carbohydrate ABC transporter membrane protein 2, CUT1 family n=1 Tax=Arboricoccus pini TaxID=1963835 RepID=A0A212R522_9PROT|nr:carbohydrate ABC transporter permease [Arboricoccus pini]SNB67143.1 carbohydrate ABC transporter membrane protein 2, CUT1 family [Arboricoccus pini]